MPMDNAAQVDKFLARLAAVPRRVDEELHWLKRGIALGWVPPQAVLQRVLAQIWTSSCWHRPTATPGSRRCSAWARRSRRPPRRRCASARVLLLRTQVLPALQRLRDFVGGEYMTAAPATARSAAIPTARASTSC